MVDCLLARTAFVASCFLGSAPPFDFLAVCFVLAIDLTASNTN
jgi:hypothetical protein